MRHFLLAFFFIIGCVQVNAQTVNVFESRCVNTGVAEISNIPGADPLSIVVSTYPSGYDPVGDGGNRMSNGNLDSFFALYPGYYELTVTDANNSVGSISFTVSGNYQIPGNADYLPTTTPVVGCLNGATGTISGTLNNGLPDYSYEIISGPSNVGGINNTGTFSGLTAGVYSIRATDSCGNFQTRTVNVAAFDFTVSNPKVSALSCTNFSLDSITLSPAPAGLTYEIVDGANNVLATSTSLPINFLSTKTAITGGAIVVRVVDSCGDSKSIIANFIYNDWQLLATAWNHSCAGGLVIDSLVKTGTITAPYTVELQFSAPNGIPTETVASFPYTVQAPISGNDFIFDVVVTDACGASQVTNLNYSANVSGDLSYASCTENTIRNLGVNGNAIVPPFSFTIAPDPNAVGTFTDSITSLPDGIYTITAIDQCGRNITTVRELTHYWQTPWSAYYAACDTGKWTQALGVSARAKAPVQIIRYTGGQPVTVASVAVDTTTFLVNAYAANAQWWEANISKDYVTNPNEVFTYVTIDDCGRSDTVTISSPGLGHQLPSHSARVEPRCVNIGDIYVTAASDNPDWNKLFIRVWEINSPGTIINSINNPDYPNNYSNRLVATNQPVGTYVIEYSTQFCGPDHYVYDTVRILPYVQPRIVAASYRQCPPTSSFVTLKGRGGIKPYTFRLLSSFPAGAVLPNQTTSDSVVLYNVGNQYKSLTFVIEDACNNGTTKTVTLKPQIVPRVKSSVAKINGCTLPQNITLFTDSTINAGANTYAWTKIEGPNSGPTILSTSPTLPVTIPTDTGKFQVRVVVPGSCYDRTAIFTILGSNLVCLNSIGNRVWNDVDSNGVQDPGEVGVSGVTVALRDSAGNVIATTKTDAYGNYLFENLPDGKYSVSYTLPANYAFSPSNTPGDNSNDANSDANPTTATTPLFTLSGGETDTTVDAGIYVPQPYLASLGDRVWLDANKDGIQDLNETGIAGVTVTLYDNLGNVVATTITNANGDYLFSNLVPGTYSVGITAPVAYVFTGQDAGGETTNANTLAENTDSDVDQFTGRTQTVTISAGENNSGIDAGLYRQDNLLGSIGNKVWNDVDNDGLQGSNEAGVPGIVINLLDTNGNILATTTTDAFGNYIFNGLPAAPYVVEFDPNSLPLNFSFTQQDTTNKILNSDADVATGLTTVINLKPGEINTTIDAGIYNPTAPLGGLGTTVWYDRNSDGIQDAGENGVAGVTVTLFDNLGTVVGTTTTDNNGNYVFNGLADGNYYVAFSNIPVGYSFTKPNAGSNDSTDSDANGSGVTAPVTISGGNFVPTLDAGISEKNGTNATASLGDRVWNDVNNNGIQDTLENGVAGVTVTLYAADGVTIIDSTTTDALGNYIFTDLPAGEYRVGFSNIPAGYTFSAANQGGNDALDANADASTGGLTGVISLSDGEEDLTIDAGIHQAPGLASLGNVVWIDVDGNGLQDAGEPGLGGVTVNLFDNIGAIVATTVTDANGLYQFTGLTPGAYSVGFSNLPTGYDFTTPNAGGATANANTGDANDSDVDPATGKTQPVTLVAGQNYPDLDAGVFTDKASLGNYVWNDIDADGVQDANEGGIPGITVTLYDDLGQPVATAVTDAAGHYFFPNLEPGTYSLGFTDLPGGAIFTQQNSSNGTTETDSDVDPSTGRTGPIVLESGDNDITWDAGIITSPNAGLGNFVWFDANNNGIQDSTEAPLAGVTISLYDGTGLLIKSAVTDENGQFTFGNLAPGTYQVEFTGFPAVFNNQGAKLSTSLTTQNATGATGNANNGTDLGDSDADPGTGFSGLITIGPGEYNPGIDAGIFAFIPLEIAEVQLSGSVVATSNKLAWQLLKPTTDVAKMELVRSVDGGASKVIRQFNANKSIYTFDDKDVNDGSYSYSVVSLYKNGTTSKSNTVILKRGNGLLAQVFPNPAKQTVFVMFGYELLEKATVTITDATGKMVNQQEMPVGSSSLPINISGLANGVYSVTIKVGDDFKQIVKLVKQ